MKTPLVLAYDFGTQSVRAIIFDKDGTLIDKVKTEFEPAYFSQKPGWTEQHADFYWQNLCDTTKKLRAKVGEELWAEIKAVTVTTFRDAVVCLDKDNNVLRPIIVWLDQRRIKNPEDGIPPAKRALFSLVGMIEVVKMQRATSFCNWIAQNEPEIWAKTAKYVLFSAYINYKFSGRLVDSSASVIGHIPFNYKKKVWMEQNELTACIFDCKKEQMAELVKPCEIICNISKEVADETGLTEGIAFVASGSDKGCETVGCGCIGNDVASVSLGTSATVQLTTDKYVEPQKLMPAYPSLFADKYNPEWQIYRGYWMITWFKKEFAAKEVKEAERQGIIAEELLNQRLKEIPPGSHGLVLQPYWSPGVKLPEAKGAIIGFTSVHTRIHLYRAIIEGIGFSLLDGLKSMEKRAGYNVKRLMVNGGGSNSDAICQITADLTGLKVQKPQTYETCALGAAMAAYVGLGEYGDLKQAMTSMSHITKEYLPDAEAHEIYEELFERVYRKIYKANKKFYREIRDVMKNIDNTDFELQEIDYEANGLDNLISDKGE